MKRVLSIQDVSCVGKCSLTVALPIISAMGVETAILPTAVLSTHTQFKGFTFRDLTEDMLPIADHWKQEKLDFDMIYTGYLGSFEQIDIVSQMFRDFKTDDNIIFVDPAMGDNGKLYTGFTPEFAKTMGKLCGQADVIVPNMTEAAFMLGIPYEEKYDREYVKSVLKKLAELGAKKSVITGAETENGKTGFMGYDSENDTFFEYVHDLLPVSYHGTGDIYSSTAAGALMNGFDLKDSLTIAADYVVDCIKASMADKNVRWYGVNFEEAIPGLLRRIGK